MGVIPATWELTKPACGDILTHMVHSHHSLSSRFHVNERTSNREGNMDDILLHKLNTYGMDVTGTMARFGGNEALMMRFLLGFPKDQTMDSLRDAMASGDREAQKVASHSLKGLSGNLGLTPVFEASSAMMNALRASEDADVAGLYDTLEQAYQAAIDMIATL